MKTYPLFLALEFWHAAASDVLRSTNRKKDGKDHRYSPGKRRFWRKTLEVFDEDERSYTTMSLFPEDREIPADALDSVQVRLSGLQLRRPRIFGNCWLGCERGISSGWASYGNSACRKLGRR